MKLQQIKLSGFKSFVDSTTININGQLIGIVGPNGCGKSNVIDAVRWVLGESSARQLRGETMLDIIFNGSLKRKPISRATVELVFDNSAKLLHGLWNNYNEISIKRLISRQGDSNYYINNQQVRRKDITDLFLGTGVGTRGYAVIEQGMIGRIIESKPEEMRNFVEEAAGISKYRERRKETLLRIADTTENLQRLEDIHSEVIIQLKELSQQSEVALQYQDFNQQLKKLKLTHLAIKIDNAQTILRDSNHYIKNCEDELQVLGMQLSEFNQQLTDKQLLKSTTEEQLNKLLDNFNQQRTNLARIEERYKHYSDLLQRFENESVNLVDKQKQLDQDIIALQISLADNQDIITNNLLKLDELSIVKEDLLVELDEQEVKANEMINQYNIRQSLLNSLKHELELLHNSLAHKNNQAHNLKTRELKLIQELNTLNLDEGYFAIEQQIKWLNEKLTTLGNKLINCRDVCGTLSSQLESKREQNNLYHKQFASLEAKLEMLDNLLTTSIDSNLTLADTQIWQLLEISPPYVKAVECALGTLLKAKLYNDEVANLQIPDYKSSFWLGQGTSLAINPISLSPHVKILDKRLFGLYAILDNYIVLDDITKGANLINPQVGLTLDGHIITADYVIFNAMHGEQNLLELNLQRNSVINEISELKKIIQASEIDLVDLHKVFNSNQEQLLSFEQEQRELITNKHQLELDFTKHEQIYVQNKRHQERVYQELAIIQQDLKLIEDSTVELELRLEDKQIDYDEKISTNQDSELLKVESETALKLLKDRLVNLDIQINQLTVDNQSLLQSNQHNQVLIEDKKLQLELIKQRFSELETERNDYQNDSHGHELVDIKDSIAVIVQDMQLKQQELDTITTQIIDLKNKASGVNSNYQRTQEKINQARFKEQEQKILLVTYKEQISDGEIDELNLANLLADCNLTSEELNKQIKHLDESIASLGLVNLKAIEDLAKAQAKEHELITQIGDLHQAKTTLEEAIGHIDNETRVLLRDTFDKLNNAVNVYFKTLFGGGEAKLSLTDSDILVAGIQIYAAPPGKKNVTIHLLSGGEKALAAMSFVFALFSLNPAPFCLLDEVDAPLDDANTKRFCDLVSELSTKTQFLYISHNRLAMEMADQLVGVTMQEKGVSTVVSVSLVEAIKHIKQDDIN